MVLRWSVRLNAYFDSIKLMRLSEALAAEPGVIKAAAVMATPLNVRLLTDDGLFHDAINSSPDDLLISVLGRDEAAAEEAIDRVDALLAPRVSALEPAHRNHEWLPSPTLERAASLHGANLAVIAVPGEYAAAEAFAALHANMHVFLFSDNVSMEDEVRLKRQAAAQGLLMMGPDCGTAIIGGVGLGFANRVERGPVGIVGASGTGIQQVCCLLDRNDVGIAEAIGTGGRDLSAEVGGSSTRRALRLLDRDESVRIIALISKPPDALAAAALHEELMQLSKPVVACLLGSELPSAGKVKYAATLLDAANLICEELGVRVRVQPGRGVPGLRGGVNTDRKVFGLFAGGTLCAEARSVLEGYRVPHELLDLGADEFTVGRAHPIIDPRLRNGMLVELAERKDVAAVLMDVILGDLAHPDPAGALLPAVDRFRAASDVPIFVTLVGSRADPQGQQKQLDLLRNAGLQVTHANALAAKAAASWFRMHG